MRVMRAAVSQIRAAKRAHTFMHLHVSLALIIILIIGTGFVRVCVCVGCYACARGCECMCVCYRLSGYKCVGWILACGQNGIDFQAPYWCCHPLTIFGTWTEWLLSWQQCSLSLANWFPALISLIISNHFQLYLTQNFVPSVVQWFLSTESAQTGSMWVAWLEQVQHSH